jgi:hypothetical protein
MLQLVSILGVRKLVRLTVGFALLVIGFILSLPLVPGPGIPLMILGLVILSEHVPWARRLLEWAKRKVKAARRKA